MRALVPRQIGPVLRFAIADQRKMPHRRHRAAFRQADAAMVGRPIGQPRPGKFRPPAEPARQWCERQFKQAARALGIRKIDIGPGGGSVSFENDTRVDPLTVLRGE